jgi:hypothetical protein
LAIATFGLGSSAAGASSAATSHRVSGTGATGGSTSQPQPASKADFSGHGANVTGPYNSTRNGAPSANGNGNGKAVGKPCAGCVGKADNKNPPGQLPNGSDPNAGYECDRNHGIGQTNPAHTGCALAPTPPPNTPPPTSDTTGTTTPGSSGGPDSPPPGTSIGSTGIPSQSSGIDEATSTGLPGQDAVLNASLAADTPTNAGPLAFTGANTVAQAAAALLCLGAGAVFVALSRRRRVAGRP